MSLWQFIAALGGYASANSTGEGDRLNREEAEVLASQLRALRPELR